MGVVAELADHVAVMYMGNIVEQGTVDDVLRRPAHPYTEALLKSIPILGKGNNNKSLRFRVQPRPYQRPKGCQFDPVAPMLPSSAKSSQVLSQSVKSTTHSAGTVKRF